MDFRQLKYFMAVAEESNLSRAAARLHISQPPLTRQIQLLEESIGATLFLRTAKGMELTDAGQMFLDGVRSIFALIEQTTERTQRAEAGQLGRIDVGVFGSSVLSLIPGLLLSYRTIYPDVKIVLHTMGKKEQIEALRNRTLTVGLNRLVWDMPDITAEVLMNERLFIAVNQTHALARQKEIAFTELAHNPVVLFPSASRPNFIDHAIALCRAEGFQMQATQEVADAVTGVALVGGGFGICLVPESATALQIPNVVYRPIKKVPAPTVDLSCLYRKEDQSPILHNFLNVARVYCRSHSHNGL